MSGIPQVLSEKTLREGEFAGGDGDDDSEGCGGVVDSVNCSSVFFLSITFMFMGLSYLLLN